MWYKFFRSVIVVCPLILVAPGSSSAQDEEGNKIEKVLYRASQSAVVAGWAWDSWTTAKAINNPIRVGYQQCVDGSQNCQFPIGVEKTVNFREVGPASWLGIQEPNSVAAASAGFDAGVLIVSHFLSKKGKWGRVAAISLNFAQAGTHMLAGMGNASRMRSAKVGLVPAGAFSVRWGGKP